MAQPGGTEIEVETLRAILVDETRPLAQRFRALFGLKHAASTQPTTPATLAAISAIAAGFTSPSVLLKHELAYCLGQTRNLAAAPYLRAVLENVHGQDKITRHEAGEALGALGDADSLDLLRKFTQDQEVEVRETCEIAVRRIEWEVQGQKEGLKESSWTSIDPAPPLPEGKQDIPALQKQLMDTSLPLFDRYRALFSLRDLASPPDLPTAKPAIAAIATGFKDGSALFRHEIAFVYGQLSHPASIPYLIDAVRNPKEAPMVVHEGLEALGSLGDEEGVEDVLREFINDPEPVVRDSVLVALDMAEFEKSGEIDYTAVPSSAPAVAAV